MVTDSVMTIAAVERYMHVLQKLRRLGPAVFGLQGTRRRAPTDGPRNNYELVQRFHVFDFGFAHAGLYIGLSCQHIAAEHIWQVDLLTHSAIIGRAGAVRIKIGSGIDFAVISSYPHPK